MTLVLYPPAQHIAALLSLSMHPLLYSSTDGSPHTAKYAIAPSICTKSSKSHSSTAVCAPPLPRPPRPPRATTFAASSALLQFVPFRMHWYMLDQAHGALWECGPIVFPFQSTLRLGALARWYMSLLSRYAPYSSMVARVWKVLRSLEALWSVCGKSWELHTSINIKEAL